MNSDPAVKGRRRGFRIRGGVIGLVLVAQAACYQRWERVYPQAQIVTGPVGLIHAGPGNRVVFERWRFVHFPMPFAVGGENFIWEVADERVREGEVIRLPEKGVHAQYQPIGHPAGRAYRDMVGTITFVRVGPRDVLADVDVYSDDAGWRITRRVRYERRATVPRRYGQAPGEPTSGAGRAGL
jgi:hypothetical protein